MKRRTSGYLVSPTWFLQVTVGAAFTLRGDDALYMIEISSGAAIFGQLAITKRLHPATEAGAGISWENCLGVCGVHARDLPNPAIIRQNYHWCCHSIEAKM